MKKSLIALAVAGAMTAPMIAQADATLYGSVRVKVVDADVNGATMDFQDNSSRIGIRGKQETGIEGVSATYRFEQAVSTDTGGWAGTGRLAYVGLNTDSGNFNFGRQWTPAYLMVASLVDILDHNSNPTHDYTNEGRQSNVVSYTSPEFSGLRVALATAINNGGANESGTGSTDEIDYYNLGVKYSMSGIELAGSLTSNQNTDTDVVSFGAAYTMDALYVAFNFVDNENNVAAKETQWELVGSYDLGNIKLLANYVDFDKQGNQLAGEAHYKLGKKARAFANITFQDSDSEAAGRTDSWAVGYRVDF